MRRGRAVRDDPAPDDGARKPRSSLRRPEPSGHTAPGGPKQGPDDRQVEQRSRDRGRQDHGPGRQPRTCPHRGVTHHLRHREQLAERDTLGGQKWLVYIFYNSIFEY